MKVGDFVQYRSNAGTVMGYGLIIKKDGDWFVIRDQFTGKSEYWAGHLMRKIVQ